MSLDTKTDGACSTAGALRFQSRNRRGQEPERDERGAAAEVLARADEPLLGQLVLPAPDAGEVGREVHELAAVLAHGPVDVDPARERLPERGQHEVVARVEDGEPDAVDPGGCAPDRLDGPTRR